MSTPQVLSYSTTREGTGGGRALYPDPSRRRSPHESEVETPVLQSWKVYEDSKASWLKAWIEYESNKATSTEARWAEYEKTKGDAQERWKEYSQRSLRRPSRSKANIEISVDTGLSTSPMNRWKSEDLKRSDTTLKSPTESPNEYVS